MTDEERRAHDNAKRREAYQARSKQKKVADKKKSAAKMREYRLRKKAEKAESVMPSPSVHILTLNTTVTEPTTPLTGGATPLPFVETPRTSHILGTPPKRLKMRQHCYNTALKMRSTLKSKFSDDEAAAITCNLVMRRTPQKRKRNLDTLLQHPDVQMCLQKWNTRSRSVKRKLMVPSTERPTRKATTTFIGERRRHRRDRWDGVKKDIQKFYLRPDISRVLPHKRYSSRHGAGHVMLVTLEYAHQAFMDATQKTMSLSLFAQLRPKNVRLVGSVPTETCLCICCTKVELKVDALNRKLGKDIIPSEGNFLDHILCPFKGRWPRVDCVEGKCMACRDHIRPFTLAARAIFHEEIKWLHWERQPRTLAEGRIVLKLDVTDCSGTFFDLLSQLGKDLSEPVKGTSYVQHLFTAYWQQSQYNLCKDSLQPGQLIMVQDFAKNRTATYTEEVKSAFFGKHQITLHPSVCYYKNRDGQMVRHIILFFSDDVKHDAHHVHVITQRGVDVIMKETAVKEVIIWSDGAASQYKGRRTFADLSMYPFAAERHFFGSEHGKGEADGETGRFSQAMARATAGGQNFRHAEDMANFASSIYKQDPLKKYSFINILLDNVKRDRPETDIATLPGTRKLHQVVKKGKYCVQARFQSCFCSGCRAGNEACCINKPHVKPFETFKMVPSIPLDEAFVEDQPQDIAILPIVPQYTSEDCPAIGQWIVILGIVKTKKKEMEERTFKAVVIDTPEGGFQDFFYVQFLKRTPAGSYVIVSGDISHISPETPEQYRWRVIDAPTINNRNHHFFSV